MSCVRFTPAVCERLHFYSARVGIALARSHDFVRLSDLFGSLWACAFFYGDPDGVSRQSLAGDPEEVQEATGKPPGGRISLEQKPYHCAVTRNADDCAAIESRAGRVPLAQ